MFFVIKGSIPGKCNGELCAKAVKLFLFSCDLDYNPWKTFRSINWKWIYANMFFVIKGSIPGKCHEESCSKPVELLLFLCDVDYNPWKMLRLYLWIFPILFIYRGQSSENVTVIKWGWFLWKYFDLWHNGLIPGKCSVKFYEGDGNVTVDVCAYSLLVFKIRWFVIK